MSGDKVAGAPVTPVESGAPIVATEVVAPVQIELPVAEMTAPVPADAVKEPVPTEVVAQRAAPPEPKPSTADKPAQVQSNRLDDIEQRMEREVEALKEARLELQVRAKQERDRSRLSYLRDVGATLTLRDDHLLSLAPDFDPQTADGRVELDRWRESNASLFHARDMTGVQVADKVISNVPSSRHGTFGPRLAKKIASENFGGS